MSRQLSRCFTICGKGMLNQSIRLHQDRPRGFRTDYAGPKAKGYTHFNGSKTGPITLPKLPVPYTFNCLWTDVHQPSEDTDRDNADRTSQYSVIPWIVVILMEMDWRTGLVPRRMRIMLWSLVKSNDWSQMRRIRKGNCSGKEYFDARSLVDTNKGPDFGLTN